MVLMKSKLLLFQGFFVVLFLRKRRNVLHKKLSDGKINHNQIGPFFACKTGTTTVLYSLQLNQIQANKC
jgi:hypothetical protein